MVELVCFSVSTVLSTDMGSVIILGSDVISTVDTDLFFFAVSYSIVQIE